MGSHLHPTRLSRCLLVLLASAGLACGGGDDGGGGGGGGVSFEDGKRGVADLVDRTYDAALSGLSPKPFPRESVPCRSGGGTGPATGEYVPTGAIEFSIDEGNDPERLVDGVRQYWEEQGYRVQQVPGPALLAQTDDDYQMSFDVTAKAGRALLGATGPCAEPESEAQRESPPQFRSLKG